MELFIVLLSTLAHLSIGLLTLSRNKQSYTHRFFCLFTAASSLWAIANYMSLHQSTPEATLSAIRWVMFFAIFYTLMLFLTIHTFPSRSILLKRYNLVFVVVLSFVVMLLTRTPLIFSSIVGTGDQANPVPGPAIPLFALTTGGFIISSIYLLVNRFTHAVGTRRSQLQYLLIGVIGSTLLIFITNFVLVVLLKNNSLLFLGPTFTLIFVGTTAYSIIAHRLFDIRVIIKRTVVYSVLLGFVLITYALVVLFFSQIFGGEATLSARSFAPNIIAAILIAFGFDPLKRWLQNVTDRYLFKGEYDPQDVAAELAKVLSNVINLDEALDSMMSVVTRDMRVAKVATLIVRTVDKDMVVKRVKAVGFSNAMNLEERPTGILLQYFTKNNQTVVVDELKQQIEDEEKPDSTLVQAVTQLEQFQTAVALPLVVNKALIGIIMVGEKLSGDGYSQQDLETLNLIGSQTALSIEKAKFYEEDKLKSEFISIASHELLSPTAAIEGYLSMLLDEKMKVAKDQQRQFVQRAYDSSRRLADLVKDLLSISRIESGRMKIVPAPTDLVALVDQATQELKVAATDKQLTLNFVKPTAKMPKVIADSDRVMQVCINLINNAIKYTPKGSVTVTMEQQKDTVRVLVKDSGIGIAKEDQTHLFEKFHRIDNPATAGIMGTGLGLYIVKNIITLLGGEVSIESELNKGSTFAFTLPVAK